MQKKGLYTVRELGERSIHRLSGKVSLEGKILPTNSFSEIKNLDTQRPWNSCCQVMKLFILGTVLQLQDLLNPREQKCFK